MNACFDLEAIERALAAAVSRWKSGQWPAGDVVSAAGRQEYIMGVDPAGGGTEGDYACAEVIDRRTAMQCAELQGHFPPRELATKFIELSPYITSGCS